MRHLAESIVSIIQDYHNYKGFQFTTDHVISWVSQFDPEDRQFILEEFLHLLNQGIYISEIKAREIILNQINSISKRLNFTNHIDFLANTNLIRLQPAGKSQSVLLHILDEELIKIYGIGLKVCGSKSQRYSLYLDDIIATGGTAFRDLSEWISDVDSHGINNLANLNNGAVDVIVILICCHNANNVLWRLKLNSKSDAVIKRISIYQYYEVQNHLSFQNQRFNFTYPVANQPEFVLAYYYGLPESSTKYADKAFRNPELPMPETFFSSSENRIRFENILLAKGVELLRLAKDLKPNHRPLGAGFPSHRTMGTGTLFFTWRNISNTCPIVFWWDSPNWSPLFPLEGRGL